ncbi:uncharacterized protein N7458_008712 [Penicillium daleae]|uniref:Subtelomeric hrmA-associated cluster protein AFUB-079030/YDR124W-like helical bundle domain-containing protein n=1 Tax=Penicillium daleae TaxID=63821 RepID=A0AAD6C3K6_9EURO|nr:uncharacterized protein N7458_008712 [Penicillium daleae]KAJ5444840.1 hypothetical protein N7458_008712 [Penicillium daleae]
MQTPAWQDQRAHFHHALIYIDEEGKLHVEGSPSISNHYESIFSSRVIVAFLKAVAGSFGRDPPHLPPETPMVQKMAYGGSTADQLGFRSLSNQIHYGTSYQEAGRSLEIPITSRFSGQPVSWPTQLFSEQAITMGGLRQNKRGSDLQTVISLRDTYFLRRYYAKVFENLQQTNCRLIAKFYVKLVEPRKQILYPYNGRKTVAGITYEMTPNETKPPWWPSGVRHREPDHLHKAERIRLLVHILCELHSSHRVTARKLKAAEQPVREQIFPIERVQLLDELYYVREMEEKLLTSETGEPRVCISSRNLPDFEITTAQDQARRYLLVNGNQEPEGTHILLGSTEGSNTLALSQDLYAMANNPTQCVNGDIAVNTVFDTTSPPILPSSNKRNHTYLETGDFPTMSAMPFACYSSPHGASCLTARPFVEPSGSLL